MRRQPSERGMSLVEVMIAVVLLVVAAMGVFQTTRFGLKLNQDARRQTRAITIAQDLLNQIQTWPYDDPRLDNTNTANDADYGDGSGKYETSATVDADH